MDFMDRFGALAVEKRIITEEQLQAAQEELEAMREKGIATNLSMLLYKQNLIDADQFANLSLKVRGEQPRTVGKYLVIERIGKGGIGSVYLAEDVHLKKLVALKTLDSTMLQDSQRFIKEAQLLAKIEHPNVVNIFDLGMENETNYYAMELIDGETLSTAMQYRPKEVLLQAVVKISRALHFLHDQGIVHRDVKPGNIMLRNDGEPILMDFGIAKVMDMTRITQTGQVIGTPGYMSPEQLRGDTVDRSTDIYSLGIILYEVLTGQLPYRATHLMELASKIVHEDPVSPSKLNNEVPVPLAKICLKAMDKDKESRYLTAEDFAADIERHLRGEAVIITHSVTTTLKKVIKKRKTTVVAISILLFSAIVGVAIFAYLSSKQEKEIAHEKEKSGRELESAAIESMKKVTEIATKGLLEFRRKGLWPETSGKEFIDSVEKEYKGALAKAPHVKEIYHYRGLVTRIIMNDDEALKMQEAALKFDEEYDDALYEKIVLLNKRYRERLDALAEEQLRNEGARLTQIGAIQKGGLGGESLKVEDAHDAAERDAEAKGIRLEIERCLAKLHSSGASAAKKSCVDGISKSLAGHPTDAITAFEEAIRVDELLTDAYEMLCQLLDEAHRHPKVIEWAAKGLQKDRGYIPLWDLIASAKHKIATRLEKVGKDPTEFLQSSIKDFSAALDINPFSEDCLLGKGTCFISWAWYIQDHAQDPADKFKEAIAIFSRLIDRGAAGERAYHKRGLANLLWGTFVYHSGGDPEKMFNSAAEDFSKAFEKNPKSHSAIETRGGAYSNIGLFQASHGKDPAPVYEKAIADFTEALKLNPKSGTALMNRGLTKMNWGYYGYEHKKNPVQYYKEAIDDFDKAIEFEPNEYRLFFRRALTYVNWGLYQHNSGENPVEMYRKGLENYSKVISLNPEIPEYHLRRGNTNQNIATYLNDEKAGDAIPYYEAAVADYTKAIDLNSVMRLYYASRARSAANLARAKKEAGQEFAEPCKTAIADLTKALEMKDDDGDSYLRRGFCYWLLGQYDRADRDFTRGSQLSPGGVARYKEQWDDARAKRKDY